MTQSRKETLTSLCYAMCNNVQINALQWETQAYRLRLRVTTEHSGNMNSSKIQIVEHK